VDEEWSVRIADFGLAVFADGKASTHTSNHNGSVRWMAPELHDPESFGLNSSKRSRASDVYAFAVTVMEVRYCV
jgi:serine/threonine-protein kinase TNNI3K